MFGESGGALLGVGDEHAARRVVRHRVRHAAEEPPPALHAAVPDHDEVRLEVRGEVAEHLGRVPPPGVSLDGDAVAPRISQRGRLAGEVDRTPVRQLLAELVEPGEGLVDLGAARGMGSGGVDVLAASVANDWIR